MSSIGETLVVELEKRGVTLVFGIPGVHTIELYRGLTDSNIQHVTPRHEQGAGFMADGYARVSGKPGVAFVITGPGLTNTLTAMGQARADSVPMLVISGANETSSLGKGLGHLHELPDQTALAKTVAMVSMRVNASDDLLPALDKTFSALTTGRPGPVHIEVPLDVAGEAFTSPITGDRGTPKTSVEASKITQAAQILSKATAPIIVIGGGARYSGKEIQALAEALDAPVVQTVNARGVMHKHELTVPASPSLESVKELIEQSDAVLALGTEIGQTDFDMFATGSYAEMKQLIRVDCCAEQLKRYSAEIAIHGDATQVAAALSVELTKSSSLPIPKHNNHNKQDKQGTQRASKAKDAAWEEIGEAMRNVCDFVSLIRDASPDAIIVGDSAQPLYGANLYYDHDRPGGWFNAATGFGALGYGIPAAIGASLAAPNARVMCITGDGGAQFSLPEIMTAVDEKLPIVFIVWNNHGYQEIATSMQAVDIKVLGCDPTPPDFEALAAAFGIPYFKCSSDSKEVTQSLGLACDATGPTLVDVQVPNLSHGS